MADATKAVEAEKAGGAGACCAGGPCGKKKRARKGKQGAGIDVTTLNISGRVGRMSPDFPEGPPEFYEPFGLTYGSLTRPEVIDRYGEALARLRAAAGPEEADAIASDEIIAGIRGALEAAVANIDRRAAELEVAARKKAAAAKGAATKAAKKAAAAQADGPAPAGEAEAPKRAARKAKAGA